VGERIFGGARAIPLGPAPTRLAEGPVALLGDAGGQVYAAHGSGIAAGLVAARMLADTLLSGGSPEDWNRTWQRRWGGLLAGSAVFARYSAGLSADDLRVLLTSGLLSPFLVRSGLDQRPPSLPLGQVPALGAALARNPRYAMRLGPVVARMTALRALYAAAPRSGRGWTAWERAVQALLAEPVATTAAP
jgi:hypothetical protein